MKLRKTHFLTFALFYFLVSIMPARATDNAFKYERDSLKNFIYQNYAEQLTNPEKEKRICFCQFGYNLSLLRIELFPITGLIDPAKLGKHSYGKSSPSESNGTMYTCKAGFIDISHVRAAVDWTVYLTFKAITDSTGNIALPEEGGDLSVQFINIEKLTLPDLASLAQKIAFERLVWHEIASWHYHLPNYTFNEEPSTFSPEDLYSDLLGTVIGKTVVMNLLNSREPLSYSELVTAEMDKMIYSLDPLNKEETKLAYDMVDRNKQLKLPKAKRNKDVWYDSRIVFADPRYIFKRYTNIGPELTPWLINSSDKVGCEGHSKPKTLYVPQKTSAGTSLSKYYDFEINPSNKLFYTKKGILLHTPFEKFSTKELPKMMAFISREMEKKLSNGFDKRDNKDPVPKFKRVKHVWFR